MDRDEAGMLGDRVDIDDFQMVVVSLDTDGFQESTIAVFSGHEIKAGRSPQLACYHDTGQGIDFRADCV